MKRVTVIVLAVLALFVVLGAWGICFYVTKSAWNTNAASVQSFGVFGDSFGVVNSLFSGLALIGVVVAVLLQAVSYSRERKADNELKMEQQRQTKLSACAGALQINLDCLTMISRPEIQQMIQKDPTVAFGMQLAAKGYAEKVGALNMILEEELDRVDPGWKNRKPIKSPTPVEDTV